MSNKQRVVVIGAGIGGIVTAALLARDGYTVTLLEAADQPGGRAGQLKVDGFTFDTGPSWYLMPEVFARTYRLLGSNVQLELDLIKLTPAYKVFFEHEAPVTITGDETTDQRTFDRIEPGAGAMLQKYIREGDSIYQLSMKRFLYTNFSSLRELTTAEVLRSGPRMLRLALQPLHRHVTRYVRDQRLQQILEYPMVFLGSSPFSAPSIYSMMSALDFKEGVFYPNGGMYTIIQTLTDLAAKQGVDIRLNSPVHSIQVEDGQSTGVVLESGEMIDADVVVSNADLHYTETELLPTQARSFSEKYWQKRDTGVSALLVYAGVRGELPELEHHNLLFVDEWQKNFDNIYMNKKLPQPASMYVSRTSATDKTVAPEGHENLFILVPLPTDLKLTGQEQDALADLYIQQLEHMTHIELRSRVVYKRIFGPNEFITRFHSHQASALGMSHKLTQSALFRTTNKSKKVSNLFYVGANTLPGIGLPMCLISAELAFERVTGKKPTENN